jgi:hypothetical protein
VHPFAPQQHYFLAIHVGQARFGVSLQCSVPRVINVREA